MPLTFFISGSVYIMASASASHGKSATVDEIFEFLENRGVEQSCCQTFQQEKMDGAAVMYASDSALEDLGLTAKGDLYALRAFCQRKSNGKAADKDSLKTKLLEQIFSKRKKKSHVANSSPNSAEEEKVKTRKFLLGWLHYKPDKGKYVMVRTADGGGSRDVDLPHDSTKDDILDYAVGMFFEGGSNQFGASINMKFHLGNFKREKISDVTYPDGTTDSFTLSRYFESTKLKKARLYLMSTLNNPVGEINRPRTSSSGDDADVHLMKETFSDSNVDDTVQSNLKEIKKDRESRKLDSTLQAAKAVEVPQWRNPSNDNEYVIVTFEDCDKKLHAQRFLKEDKVIAVYDWIGSFQPMPWFVLYLEDKDDYIPPTHSVTVLEHRIVHVSQRSEPIAISDDPEVTFKGFAVAGQKEADSTNSPVALFQVEDKPPLNFMDSNSSDSSDSERESTKPTTKKPKMAFSGDSDKEHMKPMTQKMTLEERARQWRASLAPKVAHELPSDTVEELRQKQYLELASDQPIHISRGGVLEELLRIYDTEDVATSTIKVEFMEEEGQDCGGLTQDLFSAFWEQAFDMYFDGEEIKVPFVSPSNLNGARNTFETMGRIFSHGFILTGAIPVRFCQSSVMGAFLGSQSVPETVLLRDLLNHVSEREARVMSLAMSATEKDDITNEQEDILFSVFTRFEMRIAPVWGERLKEQLIKLAQFIFVLRPLCILQWMVDGIPKNQVDELWLQLSVSDFESLYEALKPSVARVLQSLHTEGDLKPEEEVAFYYLKDFVGNMEQELLERFLRFVTGRPSASLGPITVGFNRAEGLARTPKASTCSNCLVISVCYSTLSEFKKEFSNVLSSKEAFEMHSI